MARRTARLIETSPNLEHVNVRRNSNGVVQTTQVASTTANTVTGTTTTTPFTTTMDGLIGFTTVSASISGGGAGNTATVNVLRDGATVVSTAGTGAVTTAQTGQTHTTPLNNPQYQVQVITNGGTATWSFNVTRNQRWA